MIDLALATFGAGLAAIGYAASRIGCPTTPSAGVTYTPGSVELSPSAHVPPCGRTFPALASAGAGSIVGEGGAFEHAPMSPAAVQRAPGNANHLSPEAY